MSKTGSFNPRRPVKGRNRPNQQERHVTVRSVRRDPPDLRKLSRAVIALAMREMEEETGAAEAAANPTENRPAAETAHVNGSQEAGHDD